MLCRKDHLLDEQPRGGNLPKQMSGFAAAQGRRDCSATFIRGALAQVVEEDMSCRSRPHRKVNVLAREDNGVGGPSTDVADVCKSSTNGDGRGSSPFTKAVRRLAETIRRVALDSIACIA